MAVAFDSVSQPVLRSAARSGVVRQWALGIGIGSIALWLTFRNVSLPELKAAVRVLNPWLAAVALTLNIGALLVMIVRWQVFLTAIRQPVAFAEAFRAMVLGQMINILVPLRLGEIVRVHALSQRTAVPRTEALVTIAVEKLLDLVLFGGGLLLVGVLAVAPRDVSTRPMTFVASAALLAGLVWLLGSHPRAVITGTTTALGVLPRRVSLFALERLRRVVDGVAALRTARTSVNVAILSVLMLALSTLTNYVLFLAFGLQLSLMAAFVLLLLLKAGNLPPSLPGKLGTVNLVTAFSLSLYGVDEPVAVAYAIVLYVVTLLPKVLIGALYASDRRLWLTSAAPGD